MKKNLFKRGMAGLLSLVMCLTTLVGIGTTTAYAAGERAEVYLVSFPRSGDANIDYSGTWGHPNLRYMNGWHSGESKYLINNAPFNSFIKIVKQDAETGKTIPYAGAGFKIYDPERSASNPASSQARFRL